MDLPRAILSGVADHAEPKPRSAMCIAMAIYRDTEVARIKMVSVVYELEQLEAQGQIKSSVDAGSVKRWTLVGEEEGARMELGAEVLVSQRFTPTVDQQQHLGFNA